MIVIFQDIYIDINVAFTSNISLMTAFTQTYSRTLWIDGRESEKNYVKNVAVKLSAMLLAGYFQCCLKCLFSVECVGDENIILLSILPDVVPKQ